MNKALVLLSGGIDSAACAHFLACQNADVTAIHIQHGQPSKAAELRCAKKIASALSIPLTICKIAGGAELKSGDIFARNAFLVTAAAFATQQRAGLVAMGLHAGSPYYDCSPSFVELISKMLSEYSSGQLRFTAPFLEWDKAQVVRYFQESGLSLSITHGCEASSTPCGKCASCKDRKALSL